MGYGAGGRPRAALRQAARPIEHLVVSCQENRSFDHYYGFAPQVQARRFGPPRGYTQPDAAGVGHAPFELTALRSVDPPHGWSDVHAQYNGGKMDGFSKRRPATGDGNNAIPLLHRDELPFYYSLFRTELSRPLRELLLLVARPDLAEPLLPHVRHVGRHHERTASGVTASSTRRPGRSSSTCSTTPR